MGEIEKGGKKLFEKNEDSTASGSEKDSKKNFIKNLFLKKRPILRRLKNFLMKGTMLKKFLQMIFLLRQFIIYFLKILKKN